MLYEVITRSANLDDVAAAQWHTNLTVGGKNHILVLELDLDTDHRIAADDDRPVGQHMRADRRDNQAVQCRRDNWPAGGQVA